jgi:hypothetical protein
MSQCPPISQQSDGLIIPRIFIKIIDANNDGIFAIVKRNGNEYAEVRLDREVP